MCTFFVRRASAKGSYLPSDSITQGETQRKSAIAKQFDY